MKCVIRHITLWPWPLFHWPWKFVVDLVSRKFDRNRTMHGWVIDNLGNLCLDYVMLWPWPLTPWPWSGIMSTRVPNFSDIGQSAAELLIINDRFFVRFRGCSNTGICILKKAWTDLHHIWWEHRHIIATYWVKMVMISCSVSKPQRLKLERWSAIRPKIALFDPL